MLTIIWLLFQFLQRPKVSGKISVAPSSEANTGVLLGNIVMLETSYPKFLKTSACSVESNLLMMNFVRVLRVFFIKVPFTLYCAHTSLNRVNFRCGLSTRLTFPWRCYCSADLLGFFAFICRAQPCIRKNMLNIIWENPYFDHTVLITAMFVACLCFTWCCKYFDFIYFVPISIKDGLSCVSHRSTVYVVDSSPFLFIM